MSSIIRKVLYMTSSHFYVYILANKRNGTLYIGITNDLIRRVHQHRTDIDPASFTARYAVHRLMYFEIFDDPSHGVTNL